MTTSDPKTVQLTRSIRISGIDCCRVCVCCHGPIPGHENTYSCVHPATVNANDGGSRTIGTGEKDLGALPDWCPLAVDGLDGGFVDCHTGFQPADWLFDRIKRLGGDDLADLHALLPGLLADDPDERKAAAVAAREILNPKPGKIRRMV